LISEKLEKEKRNPLVVKITKHTKSKNENNQNNEYTGYHYNCSLIKLNYDESIYTDIYMMKNYLIVFDREHNIHYLNIEKINIDDFLFFDENNSSSQSENKDKDNKIPFTDGIRDNRDSSSRSLIEGSSRNPLILTSLSEVSNANTYKKEKSTLINNNVDNDESENSKLDKSLLTLAKLNKEETSLINLDSDSCCLNNSNNINNNLIPNSKYEGYYDEAKTNFHDILLKLNKTYNKINKIDCSESNLLFADEDQKVK